MRFILNRLLLAFIVGFPFALRLIRKLLKKQGFSPKLLTRDKLRSHASALGRLGRAVLTNKGSDKTIGPRIRWCDNASASCTLRRRVPTRPSGLRIADASSNACRRRSACQVKSIVLRHLPALAV
jgi:transposase-like protein